MVRALYCNERLWVRILPPQQKETAMKLKKVTRESEYIYEIIYVSGLFKTYKSAKVYSWVGDWRFSETGTRLSYSLSTSLTTIAQGLKIGETFQL